MKAEVFTKLVSWLEHIVKIIVHPGIFHPDEAFGVAELRLLGCNAPVERKNPTQEELDDPMIIVLDVGGRFDVRTNCYDHHQRDFALERDVTEGYGVEGQPNPLAACGLIWLQFPRAVELLGSYTDEEQAVFHAKVDEMLIRGIDASDCGKSATVEGMGATVSRAIHWLNPVGDDIPQEDRDGMFEVAVWVAHKILLGACQHAKAFVDGRRFVMDAEADGAILVLPKYVPWDEHLFDRPDQADLLYAVFPSERGGYMVQQVPKESGSFEGRKPLPEAWGGLRGEELAKVCGVADAVFVHPGRFCGGAESLEGTLEMARRAVES